MEESFEDFLKNILNFNLNEQSNESSSDDSAPHNSIYGEIETDSEEDIPIRHSDTVQRVDDEQRQIFIEQEEFAEKAEQQYENALKSFENGNYNNALNEINNALYSARKADIRDNKYIILKNRITSAKKSPLRQTSKTALNTSSNTNSGEKIKQLLVDIDNYLRCDDMKSASISLNMAKRLDKDNHFKSEIALATRKINRKIGSPKIDDLIYEAKSKIIFGNYVGAYEIINDAYDLAQGDEKYTEKIKNLKDSVAVYKISTQIQKYIKLNQYERAIDVVMNFIKNEPNNKLLKNKLSELEFQKKRAAQCMEMYDEANEYIKNGDYENALDTIREVIEFAENMQLSNTLYKKLEQKIIKQKDEKDAIEYAQKVYQSCTNMHKKDSPDYENIIYNLQMVMRKWEMLNLNQNEDIFTQCKSFLTQAQTEYYGIQAEEYHNRALELYTGEKYKSALENIEKALKLIPGNNDYIELRNVITVAQKEYDKEQKFNKYYEKATEDYNYEKFTDTIENLKEALKLKPDNNECLELMEKAKTGLFEEHYQFALEAYNDADFDIAMEYFEKALDIQPENKGCKKLLNNTKMGKIDIKTCTKTALMALGFFTPVQAENIIQARNDGIMWYDYQLFAQQFDIMPHQWADVEEKILFPLKQANKYGRKIDI